MGHQRYRKQKWVLAGIAGVALASFGLGMLNADSQPVPVPASNSSSETVYSRIEMSENPSATDPVAPLANEPSFSIPDAVKQGEVLTVKVHDAAASFPGSGPDVGYATLAREKARLFQQSDGSLMALVPVSVFEKPGGHTLSLYNTRNELVKKEVIQVHDGHYRTQNVRVSKSTAGLQPLPGELETIQALKDTVTPVRYWDGDFINPTPDCQNSPFGVKRLHNGVPTGDYHKGVDTRSPAGRPIKAIANGKVQIATMYRLHGGTVGLNHGQGVGSIYIHMSRLAVKPNEMVKKGQTIGYVGSTGFATGPHLHWGLYMSGEPVNPNQWLPKVPSCG